MTRNNLHGTAVVPSIYMIYKSGMQLIKNNNNITYKNMERRKDNDPHDKIYLFINYSERSNGGQHVSVRGGKGQA